ncbi:hypothetical protein MPL1032_220071 [Mesorhizobium plurifarium]|uniref:Uncharacterized protein n=1 Tax=Mesorhizobium plurifarium TaxID=69974 RepID=A0A0K2VZM9_MESPL|nr:hypothetical protein MPL1032_220071 [Mesorhizobium plurifarium]
MLRSRRTGEILPVQIGPVLGSLLASISPMGPIRARGRGTDEASALCNDPFDQVTTMHIAFPSLRRLMLFQLKKGALRGQTHSTRRVDRSSTLGLAAQASPSSLRTMEPSGCFKPSHQL